MLVDDVCIYGLGSQVGGGDTGLELMFGGGRSVVVSDEFDA